jgi:hypothetical protein
MQGRIRNRIVKNVSYTIPLALMQIIQAAITELRRGEAAGLGLARGPNCAPVGSVGGLIQLNCGELPMIDVAG